MPTETRIGKTTLRLVVGDIAEQDTDAVVTAAHWRLTSAGSISNFQFSIFHFNRKSKIGNRQ
jgi:hypothetical protein